MQLVTSIVKLLPFAQCELAGTKNTLIDRLFDGESVLNVSSEGPPVIDDALVARGYKFTFKEAKKVLGIRLYKMLGVQPLGEGLFQAK